MRFGPPNRAPKAVAPKVENSTTTVAPVGGLNLRDPVANMDAQDALALVNFWPGTTGCSVRKGYQVHAYGLPGPVETLAEHPLSNSAPPVANATCMLYAWAGGSMFNVSLPGNHGGDTPMVTGLTNARWQHVCFANDAGVNLIAVNGVDNPIWVKPDKSVVRLIAGNGTDPNTISGVDPAKFIHVTIHQNRLWFVEKDSNHCWYLPVYQIFGVAQVFNYGSLFKRGGYVMQQIAWTVDAGDGSDDKLATLSSNGEIAVYGGTNPASADTWALGGVFYVGALVSRRAATRFGGDVCILCEQGLVSLAQTLTSTTVNARDTFFTDKIQFLISDLITQQYLAFGWEPFVFPRQNMLLLNVPNANGNFQLAMNTLTGAWTQFQGMAAWTWSQFMQDAYYGASNGVVYHGLQGFLDGVDTFSVPVKLGTPIDSFALTAFSYFTAPGLQKDFTMVRPTFVAGTKPDIAVLLSVDFDANDVPYPAITSQAVTNPLWDVAIWDHGKWGGGRYTWKDWYVVLGIGAAASLGLRARTSSESVWTSIDWIFQIQKGNAI